MTMPTLYFKTTCQYCRKVIDFAEANGISLEMRDVVLEPAHMERVIEEGGKRQVPYLVDDKEGVAMYESDDIIEYLRTHYVN